jgi:hypothetical protein
VVGSRGCANGAPVAERPTAVSGSVEICRIDETGRHRPNPSEDLLPLLVLDYEEPVGAAELQVSVRESVEGLHAYTFRELIRQRPDSPKGNQDPFEGSAEGSVDSHQLEIEPDLTTDGEEQPSTPPEAGPGREEDACED